MNDCIEKGNRGENYASIFLQEKGFIILEKNYRFKHSEIDLIVQKFDWLIFVEVKTRSSIIFGYPEEAIDMKKENKILEGANHYIFKIDWKGHVRYDVISIQLTSGLPKIIHFEDAFY